MARIKLDLDRRSKDTIKRIVVSININSKREYIQTGVKIYEGLWDADHERIIDYNGRDRVAAEDNRRIMHVLDDVLTIYKEYEYTDRIISAKELKEQYLISVNKPVKKEREDSIIKNFNDYAEQCDAKKTKRDYIYTLRRISEYYDEYILGKTLENASMKDITLEWVEKFDKFLSRKCKKNGRNPYHRNVRAVVNKAIYRGIMKYNPYEKFKIKNEETIHRNLGIDAIRAIAKLEIEHPVQRKNRDLFLLMIYLLGINCADIVKAKWSDVVDGRLIYRRAKTKSLFSIKLTDECMEIINMYKGKEYLISDGGKSPDAFGKALSRSFAKIHKDHPEIPGNITSYFSRHSFGTLAAIDLNIPIDVVALSLGHSWVKSNVTSIYVNYGLTRIDDAQRKVIDYILEK